MLTAERKERHIKTKKEKEKRVKIKEEKEKVTRNRRKNYASGNQAIGKSDQAVMQLLSVVTKGEGQRHFRNIISTFC